MFIVADLVSLIFKTLEHILRRYVNDRRYISQTPQAGLAGYEHGLILWDIDTIDGDTLIFKTLEHTL